MRRQARRDDPSPVGIAGIVAVISVLGLGWVSPTAAWGARRAARELGPQAVGFLPCACVLFRTAELTAVGGFG